MNLWFMLLETLKLFVLFSVPNRIVKNITSVIEGFKERHFHQTAVLSADYLPALRAICAAEELRKATVKRRRR